MVKQADQIQELINEIYALAHIQHLLFEIVEDNEIPVNPHCVACFGKMITLKVLQITDLLDNHTPCAAYPSAVK